MPNFRYKGFDASGQEHEGVVFATDAQSAAKTAASMGVRVRMVQEVKDSPSPNPAPASPPPQRPASPPATPPSGGQPVQRPSRSAAPLPSSQVSRPQPQAQAQRPSRPATPRVPAQPMSPPSGTQVIRGGPVQINTPAPPQRKIIHTPTGTDKDRMFLFSQFAAALKSGVPPATFLQTVSTRTRGIYRESLERMAAAAQEGISMSSVMELYPDLYPSSVAAMTRAGEVGGFLPEACETIGQQAQQAHKFRRWFAWIWFIVFNAALSIPLVYIMVNAALTTYDRVDAAGGNVSQGEALSYLGQEAWRWMLWPIGPITLLVYGVSYLLWRIYFARMSTPFRHGVALHWPVFGARTRAENLTMFSWTMGRLAKAGLPHAEAWRLAAKSAPNVVMSSRLEALGNAVGREQPASAAMQSSNLFPPEFASVVGTAELTGDLPGALDQLAEMSRGEFQSAENMAKIRGGCWGTLGCLVSAAFVAGVFMYFWYYQLPARVLKGFDTP